MSNLDKQIDGIANSIEFLQRLTNDNMDSANRENFDPYNLDAWDQLIEILPDWENNDHADFWFAYTNDVLDIVLETKQHLNQETVPTKLRYVVTTGGPHIEIVADLLPERLTVEGYWGTEKAVRIVDAYNMYNHMAHYAEMMCDTLNNY